jgi:BlaI family transcriptional regulator, penicillinase repressor
MKKLTRKEEEVMKILWDLEKAFVKNIIAQYPDPKPHYNTISSLVRLLQEKGIVGYKQYGNTYEYFPLISKENYRRPFMKQVVKDYFDNSYKNAVAFFVKEKGLSEEELEELIKITKPLWITNP